jgi:immune inhibitor A
MLALVLATTQPSTAPAPASLSGGGDAAVASLGRASGGGGGNPPVDVKNPAANYTPGTAVKPIDQPNPKDHWRMMERQRLLEAGQTAEAAALAQTGTDRVLVILAEFAGTDVFTWTAPITPTDPTTGSQWDPQGMADPSQAVTDANGAAVMGDCSKIITQTKTFTYTGPLHNAIERPRSAADRSGQSIWTPDFNPLWFTDFMFGNGVVISYTRQDSSPVHESFTGQSVNRYFSDLSSGTYTITGDVIGWVSVPHSTWYYGNDECPGARSGPTSGAAADGSVIPGAGGTKTLVKDALNAVNAISNTIPGFSWANYDLNGDGIIDRLWIVHAGYGEEDGDVLLNRNPTNPADPTRTTPWPAAFYGEASVWSHSGGVTPVYSVTQNIAAGPYIMMPENGGIGVFAHEYAHNLGADDLYAYGLGETSAGFWALQADDWTGYPIGFEPPAADPWHLDNWGWLNPFVVTDTSKVYTVTLGQASYFNTNTAPGTAYRGAKIVLPTGLVPLAVQPWQGSYYWWGGKENLANAMMTTKNPISLTAASNVTLTFDTAYGMETEWDFMWVQVSKDGGTTWNTLTNTNTTCTHDPSWIGGLYGFPVDMCSAGLGGFTDYNANFPDPDTETFNLSAYAGQSVLLRFWYMTDWGTTNEGPFVDNVMIKAGATTVFSDDAESGDAKWNYAAPWERSDGTLPFTHNFYLQWRNTNSNGGYDSALGDSRWRFGPANTGLLVWYNNNSKTDNEVFNYLNEYPGFGPKGRMLVVDSHPDPYREPDIVAAGYDNEAGNVTSRSQMRDAPFTLQDTVGFTYTTVYAFPITTTLFTNYFDGRPAVSTFNDALGYYPGAEFVPGGPVGQTTPRWMTKQWDASVTVPSTEFYGIKAPGYTDGNRMRFDCSLNDLGQVLCYSYATGLGYDGGTGNPGDINGQYGWHVQVIQEAADHTWATVKIWNAMKAADQAFTANKSSTSLNDTVTYNYTLNQNWGSPLSLFACVPLDTTKVEFVPGSGTGGAVALPMSCASAAGALSSDQPLSALAADATSAVAAVGWSGGNIGTGISSPGFGFQVKVKVVAGVLHQSVNLYDSGSLWTTLNASNVTVVPAFKVFLPLTIK